MKLTDRRGKEFGVGDTVVYPRIVANTAEAAWGAVTRIDTTKKFSGTRVDAVIIQPEGSTRYSYATSDKPVRITVVENLLAI
ncbi:hypothetical protein ABZV14_05935 [Streptosporangium canum]|uniref:hypothetical protein n=1 Tax=Streptosporangium canum TaxID=324952 RepID=UPI0033B59812